MSSARHIRMYFQYNSLHACSPCANEQYNENKYETVFILFLNLCVYLFFCCDCLFCYSAYCIAFSPLLRVHWVAKSEQTIFEWRTWAMNALRTAQRKKKTNAAVLIYTRTVNHTTADHWRENRGQCLNRYDWDAERLNCVLMEWHKYAKRPKWRKKKIVIITNSH